MPPNGHTPAPEWNDYPGSIPQARKQYRWRLPIASDPGLFVTFVAWMRERGAGYSNVFSPQFDHWDGWRVNVPANTQWQECEQIAGLADYNHAEIVIEGVVLGPCPFCGKIPTWAGSNRSHGGTLIGAPPHQFNTWWLDCCAWAGRPAGLASWVIAERARRLAANNTHPALLAALLASVEFERAQQGMEAYAVSAVVEGVIPRPDVMAEYRRLKALRDERRTEFDTLRAAALTQAGVNP